MSDFAIAQAWLIPALPLLAFAIIGLSSPCPPREAAVVSLAAIGGALVLALAVAWGVFSQEPFVYFNSAWPWISMPGLTVRMGLLIDPLTAMMLIVVTVVATLVQIYSLGYMREDPGFAAYYAYQSLFAMSMLGLVLADNFVQMFVFWELVGFCSYLLIGFWFGRESARDAAKKAFLVNRVGDFGFLIGILLLQVNFGTAGFAELPEAVAGFGQPALLGIITLMLLWGPIAKSAQFPLHVWLPDAMEGPTPVSALIHAATMVAAGVYLMARAYPLFALSPTSLTVLAYVGGLTLLFGATVALVQHDIKRILAYSTMSQLGYMMMAIGAGSLTAGMFHLMTHAFFKALLFLGAGSVILALHHEQDIREMGGLVHKMPITTWTFVLAALALSGIFPLAGFWSKDEILLATYAGGHTGLFAIGLGGAFLTAFYMFRLIFMAFFGPSRDDHAHESPLVMSLPLLILAIPTFGAGLVGSPWLGNPFAYYIPTPGGAHHEPSLKLMVVSNLMGLGGIGLAWAVYRAGWMSVKGMHAKLGAVWVTLYNAYYLDALYRWLTRHIMDGLGKALYWLDIRVVNGLVNATAEATGGMGRLMRRLQTGQLQVYGFIMLAAVFLLAVLLIDEQLAQVIAIMGGGLK